MFWYMVLEIEVDINFGTKKPLLLQTPYLHSYNPFIVSFQQQLSELGAGGVVWQDCLVIASQLSVYQPSLDSVHSGRHWAGWPHAL